MQGNANDNARQSREKSIQIMALDCGVRQKREEIETLSEVEILEVKQRQSFPTKCALHCIVFHCFALRSFELRCIALHCGALHCVAWLCIALQLMLSSHPVQPYETPKFQLFCTPRPCLTYCFGRNSNRRLRQFYVSLKFWVFFEGGGLP